MLTAARHFSYGDGTDSHEFNPGDEVPDEIVDEIPDHLILEKLASGDPDKLDRDQLMMLAKVGPYAPDGEGADEEEPYEVDEDELREALASMRSKGDLVEWFEQVRPELDILDPEEQTRAQMVDLIVDEMTGE